MTPDIILKKAIEKAVEGGWKDRWIYETEVEGVKMIHKFFFFDPAFAKALWGEERKFCVACRFDVSDIDILPCVHIPCPRCSQPLSVAGAVTSSKGWRFHQHHLLDEIQTGRDPILYLGKFV